MSRRGRRRGRRRTTIARLGRLFRRRVDNEDPTAPEDVENNHVSVVPQMSLAYSALADSALADSALAGELNPMEEIDAAIREGNYDQAFTIIERFVNAQTSHADIDLLCRILSSFPRNSHYRVRICDLYFNKSIDRVNPANGQVHNVRFVNLVTFSPDDYDRLKGELPETTEEGYLLNLCVGRIIEITLNNDLARRRELGPDIPLSLRNSYVACLDLCRSPRNEAEEKILLKLLLRIELVSVRSPFERADSITGLAQNLIDREIDAETIASIFLINQTLRNLPENQRFVSLTINLIFFLREIDVINSDLRLEIIKEILKQKRLGGETLSRNSGGLLLLGHLKNNNLVSENDIFEILLLVFQEQNYFQHRSSIHTVSALSRMIPRYQPEDGRQLDPENVRLLLDICLTMTDFPYCLYVIRKYEIHKNRNIDDDVIRNFSRRWFQQNFPLLSNLKIFRDYEGICGEDLRQFLTEDAMNLFRTRFGDSFNDVDILDCFLSEILGFRRLNDGAGIHDFDSSNIMLRGKDFVRFFNPHFTEMINPDDSYFLDKFHDRDAAKSVVMTKTAESEVTLALTGSDSSELFRPVILFCDVLRNKLGQVPAFQAEGYQINFQGSTFNREIQEKLNSIFVKILRQTASNQDFNRFVQLIQGTQDNLSDDNIRKLRVIFQIYRNEFALVFQQDDAIARFSAILITINHGCAANIGTNAEIAVLSILTNNSYDRSLYELIVRMHEIFLEKSNDDLLIEGNTLFNNPNFVGTSRYHEAGGINVRYKNYVCKNGAMMLLYEQFHNPNITEPCASAWKFLEEVDIYDSSNPLSFVDVALNLGNLENIVARAVEELGEYQTVRTSEELTDILRELSSDKLKEQIISESPFLEPADIAAKLACYFMTLSFPTILDNDVKLFSEDQTLAQECELALVKILLNIADNIKQEKQADQAALEEIYKTRKEALEQEEQDIIAQMEAEGALLEKETSSEEDSEPDPDHQEPYLEPDPTAKRPPSYTSSRNERTVEVTHVAGFNLNGPYHLPLLS